MLPELVPLCRQVAKLATRTSVDGYGVPAYAADVSYRVRVIGQQKLVRSFTGEEVLSRHTVYFVSAPAVTAHDRITLSTGDVHSTEKGTTQPLILAVNAYADDLNRPGVTVYVG